MIGKAKAIIDTLSRPKFLFLYALIIFLFLLFRNPFSQRTLIPNLEPYPDTIHYLNPVRNFVMGGPFKVIREGRTTNPGVPPLYSLVIAPFYFINTDVRMFYFANILLSIVSLGLFFLILKKLTNNKWIIGLTLFLFVTNFFIYWYPEWAMAENLILPLFLAGILILIAEISTANLLMAALIPVAFYGTKYASAPITALYGFLYFIKIILAFYKDKKLLFRKLGLYILIFFIIFSGVLLYGYFVEGINPFPGALSIIGISLDKTSTSALSGSPSSGSSWMSIAYVKTNLGPYLNALIGRSERFLWDFTPIVPSWIGELGILGLLIGCFSPKKTRFIFFSMIALLGSQILFMSMFYAVDMRYIYFAIPVLLLGLVSLFNNINGFLAKKRAYSVFVLIIFLVFGYYFVNNAIRIKSQIMLNVKYAETPWYYISVLKLNEYFAQKPVNKPYVISSMPPYYIDYYSNGNYLLLPLSTAQEYRNNMTAAWGNYDYSDLHGIYRKLLKDGKMLYVSTYGLGNEAFLHAAFDGLYKDFKLTEVQNECYTQCKIFKLELKNAKSI